MKRFQRVSAILMALALIVGMLPVGVLPIIALDDQNAVDPNYLHASYSEKAITVDGTMNLTNEPAYRRTISLSAGKFSVAWNKGNLYVAAEAAITELTINGVAVELAEAAKEVEVSFAQLGILDLAKTYNFSIKIGDMEAAWNAALIFDANVYARLGTHNNIAYGATTLVSNWEFELDTYRNQGVDETTASQLKYDMYYPKQLSNKTPLDFAVSTDAPTVVEMDVEVKYLPSLETAPRTYANWTSRNVSGALAFTIRDNAATALDGDALVTMLYRIGTDLYLMYPDNAANEGAGDVHSVKIGTYSEDYAATETYHLRMEYSYRLVEEVTVADVVYYVNGAKVAEQADVYKTSTNWSADEPVIQMVAYGVTNESDEYYAEGRVEAIVENLSVTHEDAVLAEYIADAASSAPLFYAAFYGDRTDARRWSMPLSADLNIRAEWDWNNLYLSFIDETVVEDEEIEAQALELPAVKVAGKTFQPGTEELVIPWTEILTGGLKASDVQNSSIEFAVGDFLGYLVLDTFKVAQGVGNDFFRWYPGANGTIHETTGLASQNRVSYSMDEALTADAATDTVVNFELDILELKNGGISLAKRDLATGYNIWIKDALTNGLKNVCFTIGFYETADGRFFVHRYEDAEGAAASESVEISQFGDQLWVRAEFDYDAGEDGVLDVNDPVAAKYYINGVLVATAYDAQAATGTDLPTGGINILDSVVTNRAQLWLNHLSVAHNDNTILANKVAAEAVDAQIAALPAAGALALTDKGAVDAARAAYEALADDLKPYVTKLAVLETAEVKIQELQAAAEKEAADQAAADPVIAQIGALGTVTLDSKTAIEAAEAAYAALTEDQKELVTNYATLTAARAAYNQLVEDKAAADAVIAQIEAIGNVTLNSETAIQDAETAYAALTQAQKDLVTNYATLEAARNTYNDLVADKAAADAVIAKINAIGTVTLDSVAAIQDAETAYAALTQAQKDLVTNYATLTAARTAYDKLVADKAAADAVIAQIDAIGTVTLDSKTAIETAETAYAALTEDQKTLVTNYNVLTAARATYNELRANADKAELDQAAANEVMAKINAIGAVTLDSKTAIEAAEAAYAALTEDQKALVTNYDVLTVARATYNQLAADKAAADAVIAQIDAIDTVTLESKAAIEAAETAYEALTPEQKALVTNHDALIAARTAYDKLAADKAAADPVIAQIEALGTVTLDSKTAIEAAEAAYEALTPDQKALVTNYGTLTAARTQYNKLVVDKAAADAVIAQIDAIGTVTLESKAAIEVAENSYNALTAEQKALVTNYGVLTAARASYNEQKAAADKAEADQAAANGVIAQIDAIGTVTLNSKAAIEVAEAAYETLTPDQKALVTNYTTLTAARATYDNLKAAADQAAADAVIAQIDAIGTVTLESKTAIEAAEAAYEALTAEQKALVTNYNTLTAARASYNEQKAAADKAAADQAAADAATDKIEAIGTVALESKTAIEAARAAYEALTADQKTLVGDNTLKTLTDAEAALEALEAAAKEAADKAAADAAIAKIDAIGTVTLESKTAIEAARAAYNALTAEQKTLVKAETLKKLTDAEAALKALLDAADKETVDQAAAKAAADKINAIGTVTLNSQTAIKAARAAYDALTAEQKALVSAQALKKLTDAEAAWKTLQDADVPPKTGDTAMIVPVVLLVVLSAMGMAVVVTGKKRFF